MRFEVISHGDIAWPESTSPFASRGAPFRGVNPGCTMVQRAWGGPAAPATRAGPWGRGEGKEEVYPYYT